MESKTVVILGGSVSGLLTAVALASASDKVIILERDEVEDAPNFRDGIPQDAHCHGILESGRLAIESLLPGFTGKLVQNGAYPVDRTGQFGWFHGGEWKVRYTYGSPMYMCLRPVIDHTIRQMIRERFGDKILFRWGARVTGLEFGRVSILGAVLASREVVRGSLFVDCMGRTSPVERWLSAEKYASPRKMEMMIHLGYSSMIWQVEDPTIEGFFVYPNPEDMRGGCMLRIPADSIPDSIGVDRTKHYVIVTLLGYHNQKPSCRSAEEFLEFAKSLPTTLYYDRLSKARPVTSPKQYITPNQIWRRFDELVDFPTNLMVLGDAYCGFDPAFGQGIGTAAREALSLRVFAPTLVRGEGCSQVQKNLSALTSLPFYMNVVEDHRYNGTSGSTVPFIGWVQAISARFFRAATDDSVVWGTLLRVAQFESSPFSLLHPAVLARVLFSMWRK